MNLLEKQMLDVLKRLRDEFGVVAVKAEFEAEGTRVDELLRLLELANKADLKIGLKIGGCEAIRDLIESKSFGCDYIIAPMIETKYALGKFIEARAKIYADDHHTKFLFNLETTTAFQNRADLFDAAAGRLDGCVFGRVDYTGSLDMSSNSVNDDSVTADICEVALLSNANGMEMVVGGGVSMDALGALRTIGETHLTRFETRKIIFSAGALDIPTIDKGLLTAVEFELSWLKNKRAFYEVIFTEDEKRIQMLESRWKQLFEMV
jgi:citrate lyase beta subunit